MNKTVYIFGNKHFLKIITLLLVTQAVFFNARGMDDMDRKNEAKVISGVAKIAQGYFGHPWYNGALKFLRCKISTGDELKNAFLGLISDFCRSKNLTNISTTVCGLHKLAKGMIFEDQSLSFKIYKGLFKIAKVSAGVMAMRYFLEHQEYENRIMYLAGTSLFITSTFYKPKGLYFSVSKL